MGVYLFVCNSNFIGRTPHVYTCIVMSIIRDYTFLLIYLFLICQKENVNVFHILLYNYSPFVYSNFCLFERIRDFNCLSRCRDFQSKFMVVAYQYISISHWVVVYNQYQICYFWVLFNLIRRTRQFIFILLVDIYNNYYILLLTEEKQFL